MHALGDLFQSRIASQFSQKTFINALIVFHGRPHPLAYTGRMGMEQNCTCHIKPDQSVTVLRKIPFLPAADRLPQAKASLLNQIQKQNSHAGVIAGSGYHTGQGQIGEPHHGSLVSPAAFFCQKLFISESRSKGQFLQIQPQRVPFLQCERMQSISHKLLFMSKPHSRVTGSGRLRQTGNIQYGPLLFQLLQDILQNRFILPVSQGQKCCGRSHASLHKTVHIGLPRGTFKSKIKMIHSKNSSNPRLVPSCFSLFMACFSIWRTRSLEIPNSFEISSRERQVPLSRP